MKQALNMDPRDGLAHGLEQLSASVDGEAAGRLADVVLQIAGTFREHQEGPLAFPVGPSVEQADDVRVSATL